MVSSPLNTSYIPCDNHVVGDEQERPDALHVGGECFQGSSIVRNSSDRVSTPVRSKIVSWTWDSCPWPCGNPCGA